MMSIHQPQLQHMFQVVINNTNKDIENSVTGQICGFNVDYAENTVTVDIEQPLVGGALHEFIHEMFRTAKESRSTRIQFKGMNGAGTAAYIIVYETQPIGHSFNTDYTQSRPAVHTLTFRIKTVYALDPEEKK